MAPATTTGARLVDVLGRLELWLGAAAVAALFAYPHPFVPLALVALGVSVGLRVLPSSLARPRAGSPAGAGAGVLDAGFGLFVVGTVIGLAVSHHREAALLRGTGVLAAVATFYLLLSNLSSQRSVQRGTILVLTGVVIGIGVVLGLLRGELPDSAVARPLGPLLRVFQVFPGIDGDTLDVNTRFAVHHYGLAHLLLVCGAFAAAAFVLGTSRRAHLGGGAALLGVIWLLLVTQARGAILALALVACIISALRTRWAWAMLPLAAAGFYGLLARGTISRTIESEWLTQRLGYWTSTLGLLGDLPFSGSGLGMRTFAEVFAWYHGLPDPYQVSHTHNIYLQAYAEQGLLGVAGLGLVLVGGVVIGLRGAYRAHGPTRWAAGGAAGAVLGSAIYGLTDQVVSTNLGLGLLAALLALVVAADRLSTSGVQASHAEPLHAGLRAHSRSRWEGLAMRVTATLLLLAAIVGLGPRWVSGVLLNVGSSDLLAATLYRARDVEARAASLARADWALNGALSWNPENVMARRNLGWTRLLRNDVTGAHALLAVSYGSPLTVFERAQVARLARGAGMIELAINLLRDGDDVVRLREVASQMWAARRWADAGLAYAALTELQPDEAEYVSNAAIAVLNAGGDAEQAMALLEQAVAKNPGAARNLSRQLVLRGEPCRSDERRGGGRLECAVFWFGLASRVDPTYDRPEVELGSTWYYRGRYEDAARHFSEALRREPQNPSTYVQLGDARAQLGRANDAIAAYQSAVQLRPDRVDPRAKLAQAYASAGRREDAAREYRAALGFAPDNAAIRDALERLEGGR